MGNEAGIERYMVTAVPDIPESYRLFHYVMKRTARARDPLFDLFPKGGKTAVEIGSEWGWWAYRAASQLPRNVKIYCVDPWPYDELSKQLYGDSKDFYDWCLNLKRFIGRKIIGLRGTSEEIAWVFEEKADLILVDGDYSIEAIKKDIDLWYPKLNSGGVIAGHVWPWGDGYKEKIRGFFTEKGIEEEANFGDIFSAEKGNELSECWWCRKN